MIYNLTEKKIEAFSFKCFLFRLDILNIATTKIISNCFVVVVVVVVVVCCSVFLESKTNRKNKNNCNKNKIKHEINEIE